MASSVSRQDESNPALWLATQAGKMELPCLLRTTCLSRKKNFPESHIINPFLTKLVRSRWLHIGLFLFLPVHGPLLRLGLQTRKKGTRPISSHLDLTLGQWPICTAGHSDPHWSLTPSVLCLSFSTGMARDKSRLAHCDRYLSWFCEAYIQWLSNTTQWEVFTQSLTSAALGLFIWYHRSAMHAQSIAPLQAL